MPLEYDVKAVQVAPGVSTARSEQAQVYFDSSPDNTPHLMNPAELLLSAFAACLLKNVERFSQMLDFSYDRAEVHVHSVREEPPPRMASIQYRLSIWTDESDHRVALLYKNLERHGTIYNTLNACCDVSGEIVAKRPWEPQQEE
jgi:uncharacterized OsmC-like protein